MMKFIKTAMARIPFKVSARAARLIGRENVATSQGAITELVKNAYDADATACAILFLPREDHAPTSISEKQFVELRHLLADADSFYPLNGGKRVLSGKLTEAQFAAVNAAFRDILDLWIVDNGHGMSAKTIEDHWMVIGTDVKEVKDTSMGGRVVTGAKGIGRFALDRLGQECDLFSGEADQSRIAHWFVDWGDFEGDGKIIDDVEAILDTESRSINMVYQKDGVDSLLPKTSPSRGAPGVPLRFDKGTAIKISYLHDRWDQRDSLKLKQTLEALLPPKDRGDFNIFVYDHRAVNDSGWIDNFPPDQFDYRLEAKLTVTGDVKIRIDRQEIDASKITPTVFAMEAMQTPGYRQEDFERGSYTYSTNLRKLMKISQKNEQEDEINKFLAIGSFDFSLYFFKLTNPTTDNLKRYPQKNFDVNKRRRWLQNSGGIRLYRDGFRVRPYGEPNTQGSDWLLLGQRVAANPAAAKRLGWRVLPQQLAGTIHITKAGNPLLADQSNREGIMNERAFATFRDVILALIGEFERDRSYIYHHFDKAYDLDHPEETDVVKGRQLAADVLANSIQAPLTAPGIKSAASNSDLTKIAKAFKSEERKNEALKDDIQVMRGMATLGTVLVSFTHELKQIKANMESRRARMENALKRVVDDARLQSLPEQVNPFNIVERWSREDEKVSRWIDFALSAVSPVKRRRRIINVADYFADLSRHWDEFLKSKKVSLHVHCDDEIPLRILAHEIDLDSVFYNLIVNSVEAFIRPSTAISRDIWINVSESADNQMEIVYKDNGPGLSACFNVADDIFIFGTSSKANDDSLDVSGTGIGMWLVKNIVDDYKGSVAIVSIIGEAHFSLSIQLPLYDKTRSTQ